MRLTLRTLLAYLDQILDEEDSRELERKIKESEIAPHLIQRIQKSLQQRRSGALAVDATKFGSDANSVAEYLDNTLAVDQVPDFERQCLESDDHLAEVAACHQILTLVLGEPADAPPELKQQIYRLKQAAEDSEAGAAQAGGQSTVAGANIRIDAAPTVRNVAANELPQIDDDERWTEAPDYLKRPRRRVWMTPLVVTLIAFCLAMAGLRVMGPLDETHPLAQRLGFSPVSPSDDSVAARSPASGTSQTRKLESASTGDDVSSEANASTQQRLDTNQPTTGQANGSLDDLNAADSAMADDGQQAESATTSDTETGNDSVITPSASEDTAANSNRTRDEEISVSGDPLSSDRGVSPSEVSVKPVPTATGSPPVEDDGRIDLASDDLGPADTTSQTVDDTTTDVSDPETTSEGDSLEMAEAYLDATAADSSPAETPNERETPSAELAGESAEQDATSAASASQPPLPPTLINPLVTNRATNSDEPAESIPALPSSADALQSKAESKVAAEQASEVIFDVGRFLDEQQVLITYDESSEQWKRVESGARLQAGRPLMTLPTFRVPLSLASGLQVTMVGATRGELLPIMDAKQTPSMRLRYGRLIVATFSQAGTNFGIRWGEDQRATIRLTDMETTFAVEVRPERLPGADAQEQGQPPYQVLNVYVISGEAAWLHPDNSLPIQLTQGQRLALVTGRPAKLMPVEEFPAWVDGSDAKPRDPIAAGELSEKLTTDRPITLVLRELADYRKREVRSLAACSLAQFNEFDPLLVCLNDTDLRSYWEDQYRVIRNAINRSPETIEALKRSLQQKHGPEQAEEMLNILSGFSPQQLAESSAERLVTLLDHSSCDMRVIASEMLKEITGLPSLYRAHGNQRERRPHVARWRRHLENGEIQYNQPPELVRLLNN